MIDDQVGIPFMMTNATKKRAASARGQRRRHRAHDARASPHAPHDRSALLHRHRLPCARSPRQTLRVGPDGALAKTSVATITRGVATTFAATPEALARALAEAAELTNRVVVLGGFSARNPAIPPKSKW